MIETRKAIVTYAVIDSSYRITTRVLKDSRIMIVTHSTKGFTQKYENNRSNKNQNQRQSQKT